ncbi:MAG: ribonuclease P protein component [Luteimonas sp.]
MTARFPRQARVRTRAEFDRVFTLGTRTASPVFALHFHPDAAPPRLGLAVSRKVDPHAVGRNRIKRVLRDAFRRLRPQLRPGVYVVVARGGASHAPADVLRAQFASLLQRAGALPPSDGAGTMRRTPSAPASSPAPESSGGPSLPAR